ncbi:MAG: FG-GAP repeat protein [Acidimicrobiales bacterium]
MREVRIAGLTVLLAIGVLSLPILALTTSAAASPRTAPPIGKQLAELKGTAGDEFGSSVAISGATAVVGAPFHAKDAGAAYVFTKSAKGWKQVAELKGSDTVLGDKFGYSVAISGTIAVVGARFHANGAGEAYVFMKTEAVWKQVAELGKPSQVGAVLGNPSQGEAAGFGSSVAISGTTAVVGAPVAADGIGAAFVFTKTAAGWMQTAVLSISKTFTGAESGDEFGNSVAISGTTAVVGASDYGNDAGRAYVFTKTGTIWKKVAELRGCGIVVGTGFGESFGSSVAISGTTAVVGAPVYSSEVGLACVFTKTATGWKQTALLKDPDPFYFAGFGYSVAISGPIAVVTAPSTNVKSASAAQSGAAYVFTKTASGWKQTGSLKGSDTIDGDYFGSSVAISGATVVAGAYAHANSAGRAYVFQA